MRCVECHSSCLRHAPLTFTDTESAQALDILLLIAAVATNRAPGLGHDPKPLGEPEVAYRDTKLLRSLRNREHILLCSSGY
jgi:hypothetical protein